MKKNFAFSPPNLFTLLLLLAAAFLLMAHSQPTKISPAPGATVGRSLSEIRLTFAEPVTANATITLLPSGTFAPIADITAQQDPDNPDQIFAKLPPLEPGTYTVQWQVESSDGHFVSGFYSFALSNNVWGNSTLGIVILVVVVLIAAIVFMSRRRATHTPADA